jgi:hypothetical protein
MGEPVAMSMESYKRLMSKKEGKTNVRQRNDPSSCL